MTGVVEVLMNIARWISSRLDWSRPSSWLLAAVVAANLLMAGVLLVGGRSDPVDSAETLAAAADSELPPAPESERKIGAESPAGGAVAGPAAADSPAPEQTAERAPAAAPRSSQPAAAKPPVASLPIEPVAVPPIAHRELPGPERVCRHWAPVANPAEAEALAQRLDLEAYEIVAVEQVADAEFLVWVQVPLDAQAAQQSMDALASEGVDSYVLQRTEEATVLAVGVFSSRARAEGHLSRMRDLGYEGAMNTLGKTETAHVLRAVVPADWAGAVAFEGPCDDIAPVR